jgi:hypothetical protein
MRIALWARAMPPIGAMATPSEMTPGGWSALFGREVLRSGILFVVAV